MIPIRLSPFATITPTRGGALVRSDLGVVEITGADLGTFLGRLLPLLDGTRDREAVQAELPGYAPASVAAFLDVLAARGLVEEVPESARDLRRRGQIELLRRWSGAPREAMDRLASARVIVAGRGPWGAAAATELQAGGVGTVERVDEDAPMAGAGLVVAAVSPEDVAGTERLARAAHRAGVRTLWSHLDGGRAVVGPLTVPGRTACRVCATSEPEGPLRGTPPAPSPRIAIMAQILGHLVALEALKLVSEYTRSLLGGRILIHDLGSFETRLHTLVRVPWCRVCRRGAP